MNPTDNTELTRFVRAVCEARLRTAMEPLAVIAEAAWTLKAELALSTDDYLHYCEVAFPIPRAFLLGLLEFHEQALRNQRSVNTQDSL